VDKTNETKVIRQQKKSMTPLYIVLLREELARRTRVNPQYSLRSFAKQLGIDASLLSKILKNQRALTLDNAKKILKKSQMPPSDKKLFWSSLVEEREQSYGNFDEVSNDFVNEERVVDESLLPHESFELIASPHHYILTELTRTKDFKSDIPWIAKRLNLSVSETRETVSRLLKVGLIAKEGEVLVRNPGRFTTADKNVTDSALKHHQRKILEKALQALDEVPLESRSQNSMTIAINPKKIPIAKQMIQDFVNQLSNVLESGPLEEVYQLSVSLFPAEPRE
jgi:uncharacterized protein (TIGR02147 family)